MNVLATLIGLPVTVNTGSGTNTVNLTPTSHNLVNLAGPLTIHGGNGGTTNLVIDDSFDAAAQSYGLTSTLFTNSVSHFVVLKNLQNVTLKGGTGADTYSIAGLGAAVPLTLNVGNGAATVNLVNGSKDATSFLSPVTITGTTGSTTLRVDDQNDPTASELIDVVTGATSGSITGLFPKTVTYDAGAHVSSVAIQTSHGGNNTVFVHATGVPTSINLNRTSPGLAKNTIKVGTAGSAQSIAGPLSIGDPGQQDDITVDASSQVTAPFTIEQFTPTGDTPFGRLVSVAAVPVIFRLSDLNKLQVSTSIRRDALVLEDTSTGVKGLTLLSQPNVTVRNMTLANGLTASGTAGLLLTGNTIGASTAVSSASGVVIDGNPSIGKLVLNGMTRSPSPPTPLPAMSPLGLPTALHQSPAPASRATPSPGLSP